MKQEDFKDMRVWLSYDLGANGDFDALYEFLVDEHAVECGNSVARFDFSYTDNFLSELREALTAKGLLRDDYRYYVIYAHNNSLKGAMFLLGEQKEATWDQLV